MQSYTREPPKEDRDGMVVYDLCDRLEQAIDSHDVSLFTQLLEEVCTLCGDSGQQRTRLLGSAMAKAAKLNADSSDCPHIFVSALLSHGVNCNEVNYFSNTPLLLAAERGNVEVVRLLLEAGCEKDRTDTETRTALHWACMNGHRGVVELLLAHQCSADLQDRMYRFTPLMLASRQGHVAVVKTLLESGHVNVNRGDRYGETALFDAVRNDQLSCVRILLRHNANVNHRDSLGNTPLHTSIQYNRQMAALLLISCNCDLDIIGAFRSSTAFNGVDPNGTPSSQQDQKDALELSILEGRWNLAKILVEFGAAVHKMYKFVEYQNCMDKVQPSVRICRELPGWLLTDICTPRSLKLISRSTIRKQLPHGYIVMESIDTLPLPRTLKDYIQLQELVDVEGTVDAFQT